MLDTGDLVIDFDDDKLSMNGFEMNEVKEYKEGRGMEEGSLDKL